MSEEKFLFEEFKPISAQAWKEKIIRDLKGKDFSSLITPTLEGIEIQPFYHPDVYRSLDFTFQPSDFQTGYAPETIENKAFLERLLEKKVDFIEWSLNAEDFDLKFWQAYKNQMHFLARDSFSPVWEKIIHQGFSIYFDPLGNMVKGFESIDEEKWKMWVEFQNKNPKAHTLVDMTIYQNAGGNIITQLALGLWQASEYVNRGVNPDKIEFKTAVGYHYFFEIAKLKTLRYLWHKISGVNPDRIIIRAEPSLRNKTVFDPYVNMLRTGMEMMAAVLGGANRMVNHPYNKVFAREEEKTIRWAVNQLHILKEEARINDYLSVLNGTYYIEHIAWELAEKTMKFLREQAGDKSFEQAWKNGFIRKLVDEDARKEQQLFDEGKLILTGTNKYINSEEKMPVIEKNVFSSTEPSENEIIPLRVKRLSEEKEKERISGMKKP